MSRSCIPRKQAIWAFLDFADSWYADHMSYVDFGFRASLWYLTSGKNFMVIRPVVSETFWGESPQMLVNCQLFSFCLTAQLIFRTLPFTWSRFFWVDLDFIFSRTAKIEKVQTANIWKKRERGHKTAIVSELVAAKLDGQKLFAFRSERILEIFLFTKHRIMNIHYEVNDFFT